MLQDGKPAVGAWLNFASPDLAEMIAMAGFDFVVIDREHYGFNPETVSNLARAVQITGASALLRVPANDPPAILGSLEAGVDGVVVPHVNTAADARAAVRAVKFPPLGARSTNSITRASSYGLAGSHQEIIEQANRQTIVITMLEDSSAAQNLPEILSVEGLDSVFIGPEDLAASMGFPGQPGHPKVQDLIRRFETQIREAGKPLGRLGATAQDARRAFEAGAGYFALFFPAHLGLALKDFLKATRPDD